MELSDYRAQIDRIDAELLQLFAERMQTAAGIAAYKKEHALPVLDTGREREKLAGIVKAAPEDLQEEAVSLFRLLFSLSRGYQRSLLGSSSTLPEILKRAVVTTPQLFPTSAAVACQGVEGAYSQQACDKLFQHPSVFFCATFDKVFASTAFCRWKTARQVRSTRCMISCRSTISPSCAASACGSTTVCWRSRARSCPTSARSSRTGRRWSSAPNF